MDRFFAPTKAKMALAMLFFLLLPVPFETLSLAGPDQCDGLQTCVTGHYWGLAPLGGVFLVFSVFVGGNQPFTSASDYLWKSPYLAVSAYVLACLTVWAYENARRRRTV